jgi:hypothetical protein
MEKSSRKIDSGKPGLKKDIVLSNGAEIDFKMGLDENGMEVIQSLEISFPKNSPIPSGGVNAILLREIKIEEIRRIAGASSWNSKLANPSKVLAFVKQEFESDRRIYLDEFYAHLAFLYFYYLKEFPNSPTSKLSDALDIPRKTVVNRLTKARQIGMFENSEFVYETSPTGRSGGQLSKKAILLIQQTNGKKNR